MRSVQILRAVAALSVVLFHATMLWRDRSPVALFGIGINGQAGVDLFFVISGFIMVWVGPKTTAPAGLASLRAAYTFIEVRLIRLVPLYWAATALKIVLLFSIPQRLLVGGRPQLWSIITSFLMAPLNITDRYHWPVLVVGWTLSFELMFYLILASALLFGIAPILLAPTVLAGLALASFCRSPDWPSMAAAANPIVMEFVWGMWTARLFMAGRLNLRPWVAVIGLALGAGVLCFAPSPNYWLRPIVWGGAAALVLAGGLALELFTEGPLARALSRLGDASYALYLVHGFVLQGVGFGLGRLHLPGWALMAIGLFASIPAAMAVHVCIERPLTTGLRKLAGQWRGRVRRAAAALRPLKASAPEEVRP